MEHTTTADIAHKGDGPAPQAAIANGAAWLTGVLARQGGDPARIWRGRLVGTESALSLL